MIRPTRKAASVGLGALLLFAVGANAQAGWLYVIGAGMVGVVLAGSILPPVMLRRITAVREAPAATRVGDPVRVVLALKNASRSQKGPISGKDRFVGESNLFIPAIQGRSQLAIEYEVVADRRGVFEGAPVRLQTGAPFGIARASREIHVATPIVVHPRWVPISTFPLLEAASTPHESLHERPRRGSGMEFYGLRDYRSGDSIRHVHWRSSAKGGRLLTREYEEQLASRLTVIIDGGSAGRAPRSTFEDAVAAAASVVIYALEAGHPVQLFCDGGATSHLFEPTATEALDWLAEVNPGGRGALRLAREAEHEIFRRSTTVIVFPTLQRTAKEIPEAIAIVQARSSRVMAVAVSANTYPSAGKDALSAGAERSLIDEISSGPTIVYQVSAEEDLQRCLQAPLHV